MKKILLAVLALLVVLGIACGLWLWHGYNSMDETVVPLVEVRAQGTPLEVQAWRWSQPAVLGLTTRDFAGGSGAGAMLGEIDAAGPALEVQAPEGFAATAVVSRDGTQLYSGDYTALDKAQLNEPGSYAIALSLDMPPQKGQGSGSFMYTVSYSIAPPPPPQPDPVADGLPAEPALIPGRQELQQGDIFSMLVVSLPEGVKPTASTVLGPAHFLPVQDGIWQCAVPIGNTRQPGDYTVDVTAGELSWQVTVTVDKFDFVEQNLTIDTTDPVISEANSPEAYQQYREKIPPLFGTHDAQRYWEGLFIRPVEGGWISTEFGTIRYTNGDYSNSRSHWGMDFAVGEGTPIAAPNHGRVVLAEYLLNTGWTIVIEHGGGLKSLYYHMSAIQVEAGDMVTQGDVIGLVGTTGYSTGAHLHFEMRIGDQAISPTMLFEEGAGLYSAVL